MKVYNVPQKSAVGKLINQIEEICQSKNVALSRYQYAKSKFRDLRITYLVHVGERKARAFDNGEILAICVLTSMEGHTEKCQAYRELSKLLDTVTNMVLAHY